MIKNTYFFVLIVSYLQRLEMYIFNPNTGKYGPEKTQYLDTFHAVLVSVLTDVDKQYFCVMLMRNTRVKYFTAQEMKIFIKDFFSKCNQILKKLRIWPHLLKKSSMENFIFCAVLLFKSYIFILFLLL